MRARAAALVLRLRRERRRATYTAHHQDAQLTHAPPNPLSATSTKFVRWWLGIALAQLPHTMKQMAQRMVMPTRSLTVVRRGAEPSAGLIPTWSSPQLKKIPRKQADRRRQLWRPVQARELHHAHGVHLNSFHPQKVVEFAPPPSRAGPTTTTTNAANSMAV